MAIGVECNDCGKRYKVADRLAGKRVNCEHCGSAIRVPAEDEDFAEYDRPVRSAKKSKRKKNNALPMIIGAAAVGIVGLVALVAAGMMMSRPRPQPVAEIPGVGVVPVSSPTGQSGQPAAAPAINAQPQGGAPDQAKPPQQAPVRNAEYDKNLARQSLQRAHDGIVKKFTKPKMAIVVINGVGGIESDADHYLERKLFKAAYHEYEAGQKNAQQQTDANKKQAEQQAVAEHEAKWGGFGPRMVWYHYKPVLSDVPFPEVKGGASGDSQYVYYVGPASDLNQLASRLGVGQVASTDPNSRTITITANLPVPVPDIDVEELQIQHGKESVVSLTVRDVVGEPDRVAYFLESEAAKLGGEQNRLTIVGPRQIQPGTFRLWLGPVKNVNELASLITFGSISDLDPQELNIEISAKLPEELPPRPSPAEIAEKQRQMRERDKRPMDGENEIDWAVRVLNKGSTDSTDLTPVFKRLIQMDVEDDRTDEVAKALIAALGNTWAWHHQEEHLRAMDVWYCGRIEKHLAILLAERHSKIYRKNIIPILANHPSEGAARAIAQVIGDFHDGKQANFVLREMGPVAEDAVLKYIGDSDNTRRGEAYLILADIGTKKCLSKLKSNLQKERDRTMKEGLKNVIDQIQTRLKDATAAENDKS